MVGVDLRAKCVIDINGLQGMNVTVFGGPFTKPEAPDLAHQKLLRFAVLQYVCNNLINCYFALKYAPQKHSND